VVVMSQSQFALQSWGTLCLPELSLAQSSFNSPSTDTHSPRSINHTTRIIHSWFYETFKYVPDIITDARSRDSLCVLPSIAHDMQRWYARPFTYSSFHKRPLASIFGLKESAVIILLLPRSDCCLLISCVTTLGYGSAGVVRGS
jgi:hypothetical protein